MTDQQIDDVIATIRSTLRIVLQSSTRVEVGQTVTTSLVPTTPEIDASDLANGFLNLAWAAKDVLFANANALSVPDSGDLTGDTLAAVADITSGQPFPPPLAILGGGPTTTPPGVRGQLFGNYALPRLKIEVRVRWRVYNAAGNALTEGRDFLALSGVQNPTASFVLPPIFRELRLDTILNPGGEVRCLTAEVTLTLGARSQTFELPRIPVLVLPLLNPTVVVMFSEPNFEVTHDSSAVVWVPEHSPFSSAAPLFKTLKRIEGTVSALRGLGGFAAWVLGLDEITSSVPEQPRIRFVAANGIKKLGSIKLKKKPWYNFLGSDPNFDDEVYSLLVFGLPGTRVRFFNDTNFKGRAEGSTQGNFTIEVGTEGFVAIRSLDTDDDSEPVTFPLDRVIEFEADPSGDDVWHTDMSSVRFEGTWLETVRAEVANPPLPPTMTCAIRDRRGVIVP